MLSITYRFGSLLLVISFSFFSSFLFPWEWSEINCRVVWYAEGARCDLYFYIDFSGGGTLVGDLMIGREFRDGGRSKQNITSARKVQAVAGCWGNRIAQSRWWGQKHFHW